MTTPNKDIETTIDPVDSLSDDLSPSDSIERTEADDATDSVPQGTDPQPPETPSDTYHSTLEDDGTYRTVLDDSNRPDTVHAGVVRRLLESGDNAALTQYLLERSAPPGAVLRSSRPFGQSIGSGGRSAAGGGSIGTTVSPSESEATNPEAVTVESIGDLPFDQARAIYQEAIDEADVDSEGRVFGIADAAPGTVSFEQLSGLHAGYSESVTKHNAELDRKRGAGLDKKDAVALLQSIDDLPVDQATAIYEESIDEDVPFEELYGGYFEKAASEEAQERAEAEFQGGEGLMIDQALTEQYRPKMQREAEETQARLLQEYMDSPQYIEELKRGRREGLATWNIQQAAWKDSPQYIEELKRDHREGLADWNIQQEAWKASPQYIEDLKRDRREGLADWNKQQARIRQEYNAGEGLLYERIGSLSHDARYKEAKDDFTARYWASETAEAIRMSQGQRHRDRQLFTPEFAKQLEAERQRAGIDPMSALSERRRREEGFAEAQQKHAGDVARFGQEMADKILRERQRQVLDPHGIQSGLAVASIFGPGAIARFGIMGAMGSGQMLPRTLQSAYLRPATQIPLRPPANMSSSYMGRPQLLSPPNLTQRSAATTSYMKPGHTGRVRPYDIPQAPRPPGSPISVAEMRAQQLYQAQKPMVGTITPPYSSGIRLHGSRSLGGGMVWELQPTVLPTGRVVWAPVLRGPNVPGGGLGGARGVGGSGGTGQWHNRVGNAVVGDLPSVSPSIQMLPRAPSGLSVVGRSQVKTKPGGGYTSTLKPEFASPVVPFSPRLDAGVETRQAPFQQPGEFPFDAPAVAPSQAPLQQPGTAPLDAPGVAPSQAPFQQPGTAPFDAPGGAPSQSPFQQPGASPLQQPSAVPLAAPAGVPSQAPSRQPIPFHDPIIGTPVDFPVTQTQTQVTITPDFMWEPSPWSPAEPEPEPGPFTPAVEEPLADPAPAPDPVEAVLAQPAEAPGPQGQPLQPDPLGMGPGPSIPARFGAAPRTEPPRSRRVTPPRLPDAGGARRAEQPATAEAPYPRETEHQEFLVFSYDPATDELQAERQSYEHPTIVARDATLPDGAVRTVGSLQLSASQQDLQVEEHEDIPVPADIAYRLKAEGQRTGEGSSLTMAQRYVHDLDSGETAVSRRDSRGRWRTLGGASRSAATPQEPSETAPESVQADLDEVFPAEGLAEAPEALSDAGEGPSKPVSRRQRVLDAVQRIQESRARLASTAAQRAAGGLDAAAGGLEAFSAGRQQSQQEREAAIREKAEALAEYTAAKEALAQEKEAIGQSGRLRMMASNVRGDERTDPVAKAEERLREAWLRLKKPQSPERESVGLAGGLGRMVGAANAPGRISQAKGLVQAGKSAFEGFSSPASQPPPQRARRSGRKRKSGSRPGDKRRKSDEGQVVVVLREGDAPKKKQAARKPAGTARQRDTLNAFFGI